MVDKLAATKPLPRLGSKGFTILSYNVLMPNSEDGWWISKYYSPDTKKEHTEWEYRGKLFREQFSHLAPDVICIQEAHAESFETDFGGWMREAGYENALMKKGRMRCATFWKTDRFNIAHGGVQHKDRTLICELVEQQTAEEEASPMTSPRRVFIVNCHLTAGPDSKRRLKQAYEALEAVRKVVVKQHKQELSALQQVERERQKAEKQRRKREEQAARKQPADLQPPEPPPQPELRSKSQPGAASLQDATPGQQEGQQAEPKPKQQKQKQNPPKQPKHTPPSKQEVAAAEARMVQKVAVVVCGDFNSEGRTAVRELLLHSQVNGIWACDSILVKV
jgi:hypothetical protein